MNFEWRNLGNKLTEAANKASDKVVLVSPFITLKAFNRILESISNEVEIQCFTRWRVEELASGISDIEIWNLSRGLVKEIYFLMKIMPDEEKYGLTSQIKRSVISIPSNIAEGCAKKSNKDFSRFLEISLGSCYELETQLILFADVDLIPEKNICEVLGIDLIDGLGEKIQSSSWLLKKL
jgi:four helix bundle protein